MELVDEYFKTLLPDEIDNKYDYNLIESGILDSIGLFSFIVHLEDNLKISVDVAEISEENFKSLTAIKIFLDQKLKENKLK